VNAAERPWCECDPEYEGHCPDPCALDTIGTTDVAAERPEEAVETLIGYAEARSNDEFAQGEQERMHQWDAVRRLAASIKASPLADLTAEELVALGHGLRMVPGNVMVGAEMLWESDAWKSMWEKVAHAVNTREDVAPFRKAQDADGPTPEEEAMGDHVDA
jgi:hypothetical protein